MKLPINEWVIEGQETLLTGLEWKEFMNLVKLLTNEYRVQKIMFSKEILSIIYGEINTLSLLSQKQQLKTFINRYIEKLVDVCVDDNFICKDNNSLSPTILLTFAYRNKIPTVSISYSESYLTDTFKAYLYRASNNQWEEVDILNLYIDNVDKYKDLFLTGRPGKDISPIITPIWNIEETKKYISTLLDMNKMTNGEKIAHLIVEGRYIAQLNGWKEDKNLSTINSKYIGKLRFIFRPVEFKLDDSAFLSIDLEKRAFELHNHRGKHLREISYLGEKNTGYKQKHDIILRRE